MVVLPLRFSSMRAVRPETSKIHHRNIMAEAHSRVSWARARALKRAPLGVAEEYFFQKLAGSQQVPGSGRKCRAQRCLRQGWSRLSSMSGRCLLFKNFGRQGPAHWGVAWLRSSQGFTAVHRQPTNKNAAANLCSQKGCQTGLAKSLSATCVTDLAPPRPVHGLPEPDLAGKCQSRSDGASYPA